MWAHVRVAVDRKGNVLDRRVIRVLPAQESRRLERDLARHLLPLFEEWRVRS